MVDDLIDGLVAQLYAVAPELGQRRIAAIAIELRRDMGGATAYIRKEPAAGKAWSLAESLAAGATWGEALARARVSRRTAYRLRPWVLR